MRIRIVFFILFAIFLTGTTARAATIVALGASNTYGKGVARSEAYPAQLQSMLRAAGYDARVVNAGINGDTTAGIFNRLDHVVPKGTSVVIFQPGGNDARKGMAEERSGGIQRIEEALRARGVKMIMMENDMFRGLPHQPDHMHLTPEGYQMLARAILPQVEAVLGR